MEPHERIKRELFAFSPLSVLVGLGCIGGGMSSGNGILVAIGAIVLVLHGPIRAGLLALAAIQRDIANRP